MKKLILLLIIIPVRIQSRLLGDAQISINIGDQPYYSHGPGYVRQILLCMGVGPLEWHNNHKYWVHGHYRVRANSHRLVFAGDGCNFQPRLHLVRWVYARAARRCWERQRDQSGRRVD